MPEHNIYQFSQSDSNIPIPGKPDARFNLFSYYNSGNTQGFRCPPELREEQPSAFFPGDDFRTKFLELAKSNPSYHHAAPTLVTRHSRDGIIDHPVSPILPEVILGHAVSDSQGKLVVLFAHPSPETITWAAKEAVERISEMAEDQELINEYKRTAQMSGELLSDDVTVGDRIPVFTGPKLILSFHETTPHELLVVIV